MPHEHHTFRNPPPAEPAAVQAALNAGDRFAAAEAMVGAVLHGHGDWKDLQELYLGLLGHDDPQIGALAATCLGHLARVVPALRRARHVPHLRVTATNALDDIEVFLHPRRSRWRRRLHYAMRPWTWF